MAGARSIPPRERFVVLLHQRAVLGGDVGAAAAEELFLHLDLVELARQFGFELRERGEDVAVEVRLAGFFVEQDAGVVGAGQARL